MLDIQDQHSRQRGHKGEAGTTRSPCRAVTEKGRPQKQPEMPTVLERTHQAGQWTFGATPTDESRLPDTSGPTFPARRAARLGKTRRAVPSRRWSPGHQRTEPQGNRPLSSSDEDSDPPPVISHAGRSSAGPIRLDECCKICDWFHADPVGTHLLRPGLRLSHRSPPRQTRGPLELDRT